MEIQQHDVDDEDGVRPIIVTIEVRILVVEI